MNPLDLLIVLLILLGTLSGLIRGAFKQILGLVSFWLALIISLWLYKPLSDEIIGGVLTSMSAFGRDTLAFLFLMIVFSNLIGLALRLVSTPPEEKKRRKVGQFEEAVERGSQRFIFGPLNALGGLALGFLSTAVWLSVLLALIQFALTAAPGSALARTMATARLVPVMNGILSWVYVSVRLFVPGRLPGIFAAFIGG
ncbi:MAG: CvpA family protein [Anaerolineae bacterium]